MTQAVDPADCLFCKIAGGQITARIAHEDEHCVALHDINPQAPLHLLIVPKVHIGTLNELSEGDEGLIGHLTRVAAHLAGEFGHAEQGYRTVFNCNEGAGQTVWHIHLHLLAGRDFAWPPG